MRVITGKFRGLKLKTPDNYNVRPTSDKVKEAVFSSIQFKLSECSFLDLFSGSGQMGIEALSRGAKNVVFVDKHPGLVKENLLSLKRFNDDLSFRIYGCDVMSFFEKYKNELFDVVFMDPPYKENIIPGILEKLSSCLNEDAVVICEHSKGCVLPEKTGVLKKIRHHIYSTTEVSVYGENM